MKIKVEIWLDFISFYSHMGHNHLYQALEQFEHKDEVEIIYHSYIEANYVPPAPNSPMDTTKAHQLLQHAVTLGKAREIAQLLFRSSLMEAKNLSDEVVLIEIAEKEGISKEEMIKIFETGMYLDMLEDDAYQAWQVKIIEVPYFAFQDKYSITGARPVSIFSKLLSDIWEEK